MRFPLGGARSGGYPSLTSGIIIVVDQLLGKCAEEIVFGFRKSSCLGVATPGVNNSNANEASFQTSFQVEDHLGVLGCVGRSFRVLEK